MHYSIQNKCTRINTKTITKNAQLYKITPAISYFTKWICRSQNIRLWDTLAAGNKVSKIN